MFESHLHAAMSAFDPLRPVFVEAESRRIGALYLPNTLIAAIRAAPCLRIEASRAARTDFLFRDYAHFLVDPRLLADRLELLRGLQSNETLARWRALIDRSEFRTLVDELLVAHYDPHYQRSQDHNYSDFSAGRTFVTEDLSPEGITRLASQILASDC
jgi:tRNA 2-selenouridine synthase